MRRLTLILPFDIAIYAALPKAHGSDHGFHSRRLGCWGSWNAGRPASR